MDQTVRKPLISDEGLPQKTNISKNEIMQAMQHITVVTTLIYEYMVIKVSFPNGFLRFQSTNIMKNIKSIFTIIGAMEIFSM